LLERVAIREQDVAGSVVDQAGRFNVLLRARMSDTSVAMVRAKFGWISTVTNTIVSPFIMSRVPIIGTDWKIYELGSVNVPTIRNVIITLENFAIALDAERISGSGNLLLDCLVLIPTIEGAVKLETASDITRASSQIDTATIFTAADMSYSAVKIGAVDGLSYDSCVYHQEDWALPANGTKPRLIVCGADKDGISTKADVLNFSYTYIPRWRVLRGNET